MKMFDPTFDPDAAAVEDSGVFGLPFDESEAKLVLIPVPWEPTTSYGGGTSRGPEEIFKASHQVDLFDAETGKAYEAGYYFQKIDSGILALNKEAKAEAAKIIEVGGELDDNPTLEKSLKFVNQAGAKLNTWLFEKTKKLLDQGKFVGIVGGDHSSPYGAIKAVSEHLKGDFGILHIDAHADLRNAYEGFQWSHASIMHNVMESAFAPKKLVQIGIRDFCEEEVNYIASKSDVIRTFYDLELRRRQLKGESWAAICKEVIEELPKVVFVSFDIDGLDPSLCPGTGTPVPGGLSLPEAYMLFRTLVESGRRIAGFDLNEVSPGNDGSGWNGNVGARVLYKLCGWTTVSNKLHDFKPLFS